MEWLFQISSLYWHLSSDESVLKMNENNSQKELLNFVLVRGRCPFLNHRNFITVRLFPTKFGVKIVHDSTYPRCKFGYDRTIFVRSRTFQRCAKTLDYCSFWGRWSQKILFPLSRRELISYRGDVKYGEDTVKDAVQKMFHFHCWNSHFNIASFVPKKHRRTDRRTYSETRRVMTITSVLQFRWKPLAIVSFGPSPQKILWAESKLKNESSPGEKQGRVHDSLSWLIKRVHLPVFDPLSPLLLLLSLSKNAKTQPLSSFGLEKKSKILDRNILLKWVWDWPQGRQGMMIKPVLPS